MKEKTITSALRLFVLFGGLSLIFSVSSCNDSSTVEPIPSGVTTGGTTTAGSTSGGTTSGTTGGSTTGGTTTSGSTGGTTGGTTSGSTGGTTGGTTGGGNWNPSFQFEVDGSTITVVKTDGDYGEKISMYGFDGDGNYVMDFAFPVKRNQLGSDIPFSYKDQLGHARGLFYIDSDQWGITIGKCNVTKHGDNRISGNFSGTAYLYDYSGGSGIVTDTAEVTNGVFNDIFIKG